ncbi:ABC-type branched-chain amino acid transport system, substrate-binding protein [Fodinibius roseus]|uniref:ABC-type branched-chain amino acid transport system, substrate-binding protein n=1 Tax=Fodinibius roseus TaxID=1194090 RepID=A0A1M4T1R0_9BACT|nr:ABC transporter substrate-binding protein [Fodinibius roseus]SHE38409.1 ABC-type branched-chain amino acid transport system, substrate-binding protein [Fodinibius roseus]
MKLYFPYISRPLLLVATAFLLLAGPASFPAAHGQSLEKGIKLYQDGEYAKAAGLFDQIHSDQGLLFAGKSYFGMKDYATARSRLLNIREENNPQILTEANYTLSLIHFKQKDFGEALSRLAPLTSQQLSPEIAAESNRLYEDLLKYLTFEQRNTIMDAVESDSVRYDLVSSALGRVELEEARTLFTKLRNGTETISSDQLEEISSLLSDDAEYADLQEVTGLEAPGGLTYTIGVALPAYSPDKNDYPVVRGLYLGYTLAAEQFNRRHEVNVELTYHNTGIESDSARQALEVLSSTGVDAVVGPLFSERAQSMAKVSSQHRTPILAPLANSESITRKDGYFFQVNPPLSIHGKNMARFAVRTLNFDKIAVLAERGTLGEISAKAFRREMEQLNAEVPYFFVENLGSSGYGLSQYTRYFTEDRLSTAESSVSAVYAPFTGDATPALIDHLLGQLNSLESNVAVLGSQEWANANTSTDKIGTRAVYFTESFYSRPGSAEIDQFESRFRDRFNQDPNRFAMIGYDTAMFLLQTLDRVVNPALLKEGLADQPPYNGLITNIHFNGSNINQKLMLFKITNSSTHLISE